MTQNAYKRSAAEAALAMIEPGAPIGIGTGSTVNFFIDALASSGNRVEAAVSSSEASSRRLEAAGIRVIDLNEVDQIPLYVDGADECNRALQLIKGGGGALTREKIVAAASDRFVCVIDDSKLVDELGTYPLPVEVIPMACGLVARYLRELGGQPQLRHGFTTDNGHQILDVHNLKIADPPALESRLNDIPGVVTVGLFAIRPADLLLLGGPDGVREIYAKATFASVSD